MPQQRRRQLVQPVDRVRTNLEAALSRLALIEAAAGSSDLDELREQYRSWCAFVEEILRNAFSVAELAEEFRTRSHLPIYQSNVGVNTKRTGYLRAIRAGRAGVESILERLSLLEGQEQGSTELGERVFIVHGRQTSREEEVARTVHRLTGQEPVILHERPSGLRTVIEKFEEESEDAGFAVVILTGDDEGRLRDAGEPLRPRARQNVILELGYFIARLGRERVALLYEEGVELPSDIGGVLYTSFRSDTWRYQLGKELRALGLGDVNRL